LTTYNRYASDATAARSTKQITGQSIGERGLGGCNKTMARTRNIKPGFFKDEELVDLGPHVMLCFAGLWTLADRDGRLEDRPRLIKAEVFPYTNVNVEKLLSALAEHKFIIRYEVDGEKYIQIRTWKKHQNPNIKEGASTIPAPFKHSSGTVPNTESAHSEHGADTVPAPNEHITDTALNLKPLTSSQQAGKHARKLPSTEPEPAESQAKGACREAVCQVRQWLEQYMRQGFATNWPPPSDQLCEQLIESLNGSPLNELHDFLLQLHTQKRKPEKSYAWFVPVVRERFGGGHAGPVR
jgi:hypothetical protein